MIWSRSMIEEAWGKDVFAKGRRIEEDEAADEDVRELIPRVKRPWSVLGISASCRTSFYARPGGNERKKADLGVIDEGSDHDGEFEMGADDDHGEFQKGGEDMIREIQDLVARLTVDGGQQQNPMYCPGSTTGGIVPNGKYLFCSVLKVTLELIAVFLFTPPTEDNGHVEDPTHRVCQDNTTRSPQDVSPVITDERHKEENGNSSATNVPSSTTPNTANTKEGVDHRTSGSLDDSHSRSGVSDGKNGCGLNRNNAAETQEVIGKGFESHVENIEDSAVNENGGLAKGLVRDEKGTKDVSDCIEVTASDIAHCQLNMTPSGLCENSGLSEIPVTNPPDNQNAFDESSSDATRAASKGFITEGTDMDADNGGVINGCAVHVDRDAKVNVGGVDVGIGITNADILHEQLANKRERLGNDNHGGAADDITTSDSEPSDNNLPSDTTYMDTGKPRFDIKEGPKLEEWIPAGYLPEVLVVYDPDGVSSFGQEKPPMKIYKRTHPVPCESTEGDAVQDEINDVSEHFKLEKTPTAQLFLYTSALIGEGNHSYVYRASLRPPTPLYVRDSPHNVVSVAAKLASDWYETESLDNEARMYAGFEKHMAEEWCGFNKVDGVTQPVRATAVVPKFYGYYVHEAEIDDKAKANMGSPILLLEECGTPVEPSVLTRYQRTEMYSLFCRLHEANVSQHSASTRNMVVQPGPIILPPSQRSMQHPSFRVIDFGSGRTKDKKYYEREKNHAREELDIDLNDEQVSN